MDWKRLLAGCEKIENRGLILKESVRRWILEYYGTCEADDHNDECGACAAWKGYRAIFERLDETQP